MQQKHPICQHCAHYYVTWDPRAPHGCRAYGFKSRKRPAQVVFENSGIACALHENKAAGKPSPTRSGKR